MIDNGYYRSSTIDRMPVEKLSISLDKRLVDAIRDEAASRGIAISGLIAAAVEERLAITRGLQGVAEWEAEHGALTEEELAEADRIIDSWEEPTFHGDPSFLAEIERLW